MAKSLKEMIESQIIARGVKAPAVLNAMLKIDRADFVPESEKKYAYSDSPLPIGENQTISQPYIVALMTESLGLDGNCKVLEIGTGSGYQTAILAAIAKEVVSVERVKSLLEKALKNLEKYNFNNVKLILGDGKEIVFPEKFDRIIITAAASEFPQKIFDNLKEGGIMVAPIEQGFYQVLYQIKKEEGKPVFRELCPVRFVPLI